MWADLLRETQSWTEPPTRPTTPIHHPSTATLSNPEAQKRDTENEADVCDQSTILESCSTSSPRPSYASVLKGSRQHSSATESRSSPHTRPHSSFSANTPDPKYRPNQASPISTPTLTVEDLRNRFHNKPSPFKLAGAHQMPTNRDHLTAVASEALSNFLLSALPAFRDFYLTFTMGSCRHPSQDQRFCSRGPTGPPGRNLRRRPTTGP